MKYFIINEYDFIYKNYCAGIYNRNKFYLAHPKIKDNFIFIKLVFKKYEVISGKLPFNIIAHIAVLAFNFFI